MSSSCQRSSSSALGGGFLGGFLSKAPKLVDVDTTFNGVATGLWEEYKGPLDWGGFEGALKLNFLCDIVLFKNFVRRWPVWVLLRHLFTILRFDFGGWTSEVCSTLLLFVPENKPWASLIIVNVDMNFYHLPKSSHRKSNFHGKKQVNYCKLNFVLILFSFTAISFISQSECGNLFLTECLFYT